MSIAVGIDLGTTHTCVAVYRHGFPEIIKNNQRGRTTPSVVYFGETLDDIQIGRDAKRQLEYKHGQTNTIYDAKRIIGKKFKDTEVSDGIKKWPFRVVSIDGKPNYEVSQDCETKRYTPIDVSSLILGRMRETVSNYLCVQNQIEEAVITVPAYFNHMQRISTIQAAKKAGFKKIHLLNEPVASAIAYGIQRKFTDPLNVLVFDLGGGTCDVSIVHINGHEFKVLASAGNTNIGGQDFDERIVDHFIKQINDDFGVQLDKQLDRAALYNLRCAAESLKNDLSSMSTAKCSFAYPLPRRVGEYEPLTLSLTRSKFEELCADLFEESMKPIRIALTDANVTSRNLKFAILVGGCSRIIRVQTLISELLHNVPILKDIDPDEAIAQGAAIEAFRLHSSGELSDIAVSEVTARSLGIAEGVWLCKTVVFVPRNTRIPFSKTVTLSTNKDYQTSMKIKVVEGDHVNALMNDTVGKFTVEGIPPERKGLQRIVVRFDVGANGVLDVTATVHQTGVTRRLSVSFADGTQDRSRKQTESNVDEKQEKNRLKTAQAYWDRFCFILRCIQEQPQTFTNRDRMATYVKRALDWIDGANWRTSEEIRAMSFKVQRKLEEIIKSSSKTASDSSGITQLLCLLRKRPDMLRDSAEKSSKKQKLRARTGDARNKSSSDDNCDSDNSTNSDDDVGDANDNNSNEGKKSDGGDAPVEVITIDDDDDEEENGDGNDDDDGAIANKSIKVDRDAEDDTAGKGDSSDSEEASRGAKDDDGQNGSDREEGDSECAVDRNGSDEESNRNDEDACDQNDEENGCEDEGERNQVNDDDGNESHRSADVDHDDNEVSDGIHDGHNESKIASDEASENGDIWISDAE